ncbi:hypothetical protein AUC69_06090 [Methyloceanibacter superfactus]|uniref:Uncharacterized protein n=1 Tax=Methyloceanibacter superfactus TaxID=1774969 RepID=A0A1E3W7J6_9HYPH|nr:hypothetical protein [Methyloceanibacter superfactus]ODS01798.1 hypothetical protein AUC69_06090 [Methyloceanibacter superfactus]
MTKGLFLSTALAASLLFAGSMQPAGAAPSAPAMAQATAPFAAQSALLEDAAWRCGPRRCWWVRNYWGPVPDYALGWGPPLRPDCYWKRGLLGKWKHKCDD